MRRSNKFNSSLRPLSLGCMSLDPHDPESLDIISRAIELGINYLDTADLYDRGYNEEMVGRAIRSQRHNLFVSTKVGNRLRASGDGWDWAPSKKYLLSAVEESLRRLKTDYIDLYMLHGGTKEDPFDEIVEAFERLIEQGKIRGYGLSSIRPNVIQRYLTQSNISALMMPYSVLDRRADTLTPFLQDSGIELIGRGALAQGLLTGKQSRAYLQYSATKVEHIQTELWKLARSNDLSPIEMAIGYALSNKQMSTLVLGIRTQAQLDDVAPLLAKMQSGQNSLRLQPQICQQVDEILSPQFFTEHLE